MIRSPISLISSMRCVMNTIPAPSLLIRVTIRNRRSRVATSSADVASSRMRMPERRIRARTMPHAWRSLNDSSSTGVSSDRVRPRSSSSAALARARFSRTGMRLRNRPSTPSHTLSSTERASATRTSWKTVTMPSACAVLGDFGAGISAPRSSIAPASGACTPLRIFTIVLLPDPFSPTSAWTSPARNSNDAPRSACVAPKALARPDTRMSTVGCSVAGVVAGTSVVVMPDTIL